MQKHDLTAARAFYSEALEITQIADLERAKLLGNRSVCYTQLGYSDLAKADAEEAADLAPEWGKAHYRLGCLRLQVTEHHSSPLITTDYHTLSPTMRLQASELSGALDLSMASLDSN